MYGMGCVGALVYGGGVYYLPDSPRWLLLKNLKSPYQYPRDLARDALVWFRGDLEGTAIDVEIAHIVDSLQAKVIIIIITKIIIQIALTITIIIIIVIIIIIIIIKSRARLACVVLRRSRRCKLLNRFKKR
jgi:hypothetical protein